MSKTVLDSVSKLYKKTKRILFDQLEIGTFDEKTISFILRQEDIPKKYHDQLTSLLETDLATHLHLIYSETKVYHNYLNKRRNELKLPSTKWEELPTIL